MDKRITRSRACKRVRRSKSAPSTEVAMLTKQPIIRLEKSFVSDYLRTQSNIDLAQSVEVISLDESSNSMTEANKSVVFVREDEASPKTKKIADQNATIAQLTTRVQKLNIHVEALQRKLLEANDINQNNAIASNIAQQPAVQDDAPEQVESDEVFDKDFDAWCAKQLDEWNNNGELSQVCRDFAEYINDMDANSSA